MENDSGNPLRIFLDSSVLLAASALLGKTICGLRVLKPGNFLCAEREVGRLCPVSPP